MPISTHAHVHEDGSVWISFWMNDGQDMSICMKWTEAEVKLLISHLGHLEFKTSNHWRVELRDVPNDDLIWSALFMASSEEEALSLAQQNVPLVHLEGDLKKGLLRWNLHEE